MKNRTFPQSKRARTRPRRRGTARLFVLGAAVVASTAVSGETTVYAQQWPARDPASNARAGNGDTTSTEPARQARTFDISAGTIGSVAQRFTAITGIGIAFANEMVRDLPSPGVSGVMTPTEALEQILVGTGVGFALHVTR